MVNIYFRCVLLFLGFTLGSERACFFPGFLRAEKGLTAKDTRDCSGAEEGRMSENGITVEKG